MIVSLNFIVKSIEIVQKPIGVIPIAKPKKKRK